MKISRDTWNTLAEALQDYRDTLIDNYVRHGELYYTPREYAAALEEIEQGFAFLDSVDPKGEVK